MNPRGFTLIELLVVISVIGILASIVLVSMQGARDEASMAQKQSFASQVNHALGAYASGIWKFDKGNGTTAPDASGFGNDGTINGASWTPEGDCVFGQCLDFDGTDDYVQVPNDKALNMTEEVTLSAWINPDDLTSWPRIIRKGTGYNAYELYINETGDVNFALMVPPACDKDTNKTLQVGGVISADTWTHVVATFDGSEMKIYIDGQQEENTLSYSGTFCSADVPVRMGYDGSYPFNGQIDDARIFARALSVAQVQKLYARGASRFVAIH